MFGLCNAVGRCLAPVPPPVALETSVGSCSPPIMIDRSEQAAWATKSYSSRRCVGRRPQRSTRTTPDLQPHGVRRYNEKSSITSRGTSPEYALAKIRKDRPPFTPASSQASYPRNTALIVRSLGIASLTRSKRSSTSVSLPRCCMGQVSSPRSRRPRRPDTATAQDVVAWRAREQRHRDRTSMRRVGARCVPRSTAWFLVSVGRDRKQSCTVLFCRRGSSWRRALEPSAGQPLTELLELRQLPVGRPGPSSIFDQAGTLPCGPSRSARKVHSPPVWLRLQPEPCRNLVCASGMQPY